jgi:hypothetical protein
VATRSDLRARCLIVWLSAIPENRRRAEAELLEAYCCLQPQILGAPENAWANVSEFALQHLSCTSLTVSSLVAG